MPTHWQSIESTRTSKGAEKNLIGLDDAVKPLYKGPCIAAARGRDSKAINYAWKEEVLEDLVQTLEGNQQTKPEALCFLHGQIRMSRNFIQMRWRKAKEWIAHELGFTSVEFGRAIPWAEKYWRRKRQECLELKENDRKLSGTMESGKR